MRFRWWHVALLAVGVVTAIVVYRSPGGQLEVSPTGTPSVGPAVAISPVVGDATSDSLGDSHPDPLVAHSEFDLGDGDPLADRSADGAARSVLFFLELGEEVITMAPADGAAVQRRFATTATAHASAMELERQLTALSEAAGPGMSLDVAPISWLVAEIEPSSHYAVSVWYVEVFSLGGPTDAIASFKTYSASVRWEDGAWRLADATVFDGPQPPTSDHRTVSGPELRALLAGYTDGASLLGRTSRSTVETEDHDR
jgi:hypothetical protein